MGTGQDWREEAIEGGPGTTGGLGSQRALSNPPMGTAEQGPLGTHLRVNSSEVAT